ncbi:MAG TPA: hypothetical protein VMK83_04790 [Gaiellaceae bacterium]|nr:hypothetical protein [Gaiellaceae bacterium]
MKLLLTLVAATAAVAGAAYISASHGGGEVTDGSSASRLSVAAAGEGSALDRLERSAKVKASTRRSLGTMRLSAGREIELFMAQTSDGTACVIERESGVGASASCLVDGLFRHRKVEFSIRFEGGPRWFDELYVSGVVAPSIHAAELVMTNGAVATLSLTAGRTFLFESTREALERGIHPTAFRLYGPRGKLVETHTFRPPGS